jgi:two-component system cell cycle sensor histidine kinase/response regulator CckA
VDTKEMKNKSREDLLLEIQQLSTRLAEAEETLRAIRNGEVDALVVTGAQGDQIYTLKSAEQPYRILMEEMREGAITLAEDDTILYSNRSFAQMLKIPLEKVIGNRISYFVSSVDQPVFEELLRQGRSGGGNGDITFIAGDGTPVPVHLSINNLPLDGISTVHLFAMDLTEHRRAEEQIREQATLLDRAHEAIGVRDLNHNIIYWNKGAERMYGWTADEAIGKSADSLVYKEQPPALIEAKKSIIEKGEWEGELHQITKNGKAITVESRWTLVRDNEGKPKSILIINTDVTEKKKLESQLLRAQRMESIGTLAGGIAHDLNNVLTPIMLSLQMLKEKYEDEQSQRLLSILENNSQRGANLIKQVLSFARGIEGERNPPQVTNLVSETERTIKEVFPRNIETRKDISPGLWIISGDATQLYQVVMNLCVNARDAMPDGGILGIKVENFLIDESYARMNSEAKVGHYIIISISDTGTGIPPKVVDRIFEPFFTTKEQGKGTGLGLSTALTIVKSHGGFIDVHSSVGEGTTFKVYLPAVKTELQKEGEIQQPDLPMGHGESILVAEDEDSIREVTTATLEKYGYKVHMANDGAEAVALYAQNKDNIKAVLMDMMMPVMDGHSSIQAIRRINSEIKIIAVSGLVEGDKLARTGNAHIHAFLQKPYTAESLLKTIHEVISAE